MERATPPALRSGPSAKGREYLRNSSACQFAHYWNMKNEAGNRLFFYAKMQEMSLTIYTRRCIIILQGKGKGGKQNKRKEDTTVDEQKEKQTKELLEVLEKALRSEAVERITITIKPNQKPKQS